MGNVFTKLYQLISIPPGQFFSLYNRTKRHLVCCFLPTKAPKGTWCIVSFQYQHQKAKVDWGVALQGEAKKAKAVQAEAAKKEIAELMAKAKADMDKADKKGEAKAAQSQADEIQKEVPISSDLAIDASAGTVEMFGLCTLNSV